MVSPTGQNVGAGTAPGAKPPLRFRSRSLDQTLEFLYGNNICLQIARHHQRSLNVRVNGIYLPAGVYIGSTEYGATANVQVRPERLDYWLLIPVRGQMETTALGHHFISNTQRAFLFSYPAMGPSRIVVDAGALRMTVVMSHATLHQQLAILLGRSPGASFHPPLEFAPTVDLTSGHGRSIARLARLVLGSFEHDGDPLVHNPIALGSLEQFVITELLLSQPHNYTDALYDPAPAVAPRGVKRAIDYMEANLQAPLTLTDIVAAAGVPGRTLFKHFEVFRGIPPMGYLRASRFERIRQALKRGETTRTVADLAMSWGFTHMGRFSTEYRKRFGESPSETLRQSGNCAG